MRVTRIVRLQQSINFKLFFRLINEEQREENPIQVVNIQGSVDRFTFGENEPQGDSYFQLSI